MFLTNTEQEGEPGKEVKRQRIHIFKRGIWNILEM